MPTSTNTSSPKTVLIIGAGASAEAKLPIGSELKNSIANALDIRLKNYQKVSGDRLIYDALHAEIESNNRSTGDINVYMRACQRIRDAMPQTDSIDQFIHTSNDKAIELCGKLAIVQTIRKAEAASILFIPDTRSERMLNFKELEESWFNCFTKLLFDCRIEDVPKRLASIVLIVFNYDRCIEHYLFYAIQNFYGINPSDAAQLLQGLEVYHPYGTVGAPNGSDFGSTLQPKKLLELANQIKTFTEGTDPSSSQINKIQSHMKAAHRLIFLGFAFHRLNLDLLMPKVFTQYPPTAKRIFATGLGLSISDTDSIAAKLRQRCQDINIKIRNDLKCSQLFKEYKHSMSFD